MTLLAALLAAAAAGVAVASPVRSDRLSGVVQSGHARRAGSPGRAWSTRHPAAPPPPRDGPPSASGLPPWARHAASGMAGLAIWWVVGGHIGVVVGLAATAVGPRLLGRLDDVEGDDGAVAAQLPLALDLLAACLLGGASVPDAVRAVSAALPGACGARLARVGAALAVVPRPAKPGGPWVTVPVRRGRLPVR